MLEGDAMVRATINDEAVLAHDGAPLQTGMGVRSTKGTGVTIKVPDAMTLRMAPETVLSVRPFAVLPPENPAAQPLKAFQVLLTDGDLDVEVHDPNLGLIVQLPNGRSVGVWRGSANISMHGEQATIAVYEGMGIAGSPTKWKPMTTGNGVVLPIKGDPSNTKPIPEKPEWSAQSPKGQPQSFAMVRGDERAVLGATWKPVRGATTYRVELGDPKLAGPEVISRARTPQLMTDPLVAGVYGARVRAVSSDGIQGPPSTIRSMRILKVSLPPSAVAVRDGAVVLPAMAGVTIDDPSDLQVATAYDGSALTLWSPAPNELTVGDSRRRDIHIRHVPSGVESRIVLVRRDLHAKIVFNPKKHPRWPENPVDITVKVEDPSGYLDAAKEPVDVDVRVDVDKVDLPFRQAKSTWSAHLDPHANGAGPWVVRVDVHDKMGVPIGAGLLDVDPVVEPEHNANVTAALRSGF